MAYAAVKERHWFWRDMSPFWWFWLAAWRGGSYFKSSSARSIPASTSAGQVVRSWKWSGVWEDAEPPTVAWLWSHDRESDHDYAERVMRASWRRYAGYAIDVLSAGVCTGVDNPTARLPDKWFEKVTLEGANFQSFRAQVATETSTFGHTWGGSDKGVDGKPYLYTVNPLNLTHYRMGRNRQLEWAIVREPLDKELEPVWKNGEGSPIDRRRCIYRLWTKNTVEVVDEDGNSIPEVLPDGTRVSGERKNPYGRVPLEPIFYARDLSRHEPCGLSVMEDLADVNLHEYNVRSMRDVILLDTAFPFLAVQVPEGETKLRAQQTIEVATNRWVAYFGTPPVWIQPGPEAIATHTELLKEDIDSIRELSGLKTPQDDTSGVVSATSMRIMRANLSARFGAHGRNLKDGEERIIGLAQQVAGLAGDGVQSPFPADYREQEDQPKLDLVIAKLDSGLRDTPEAKAELLKEAFKIGSEGRFSPEQIKKIEAAIDAKAMEPPEPPEMPGAPEEKGVPMPPNMPPNSKMREMRKGVGK